MVSHDCIEDGEQPTRHGDERHDLRFAGGDQAVEHYEIARYGALAAWAKLLGHNDAARLLAETLEEEKAADEVLNRLAESINPEAEAERKAA